MEAELKKFGKTYEFHSFDNAGHGFFGADRPDYRRRLRRKGGRTSSRGTKSISDDPRLRPVIVNQANEEKSCPHAGLLFIRPLL